MTSTSTAKGLVKALLRRAGYELRRIDADVIEPGSDRRPVGNMQALLEDLKHRGLCCTTIIDVGANQGSWSLMAKRVFPSANLILVEPQLDMKPMLETFVAEFPGSHFVMAGAGAKPGMLTLTIWDDRQGSSFLPKPDVKASGKQRQVEIVTIDDLLRTRGLPIPELIKLDIQGFEIEALKGAAGTFGRTDAYILEVSLFSFDAVPDIPLFSDVVHFMLNSGYVVYDFPGFLRRPLDGALGQCDICFVKRDGFLRTSNRWA
jgi:FkbM family methyltransferase